MISWSDVDFLAKLARFAPYIFIFLGFLIAISGQFVKTKIESRIADLHETESVKFKNTRPEMNVLLGKSVKSGKILLAIDAINLIPFKASWYVATEDNKVVSGILIVKPEIFPREDKRRFTYNVVINDDKVINNYIELRFSFESISAAELNNPEHLKGDIVKKYRYFGGNIFHWEKS